MHTFRLKRIYDASDSSDGFRVLVDRLWPRGMKKEDAHIDLWMKNVAPSTELRKWLHHDPGRWKEFDKLYRAELRDHEKELEELRLKARRGAITLLYGAKDVEHNHAVVLKKVLEHKHRYCWCFIKIGFDLRYIIARMKLVLSRIRCERL